MGKLHCLYEANLSTSTLQKYFKAYMFSQTQCSPVKCLKIITNRSPVHNMQTCPARKLGGGLIRKQLINGEYIKQISKKTGWGSHPPTNQNVKSPNSSGYITLIRKLRFLTSHLQKIGWGSHQPTNH